MRLKLRTKTALLITSLVLALVGVTGWWQYRNLSSEYVNLMREQQQALTESAAADLDYKLGVHLAALARAARDLGVHGLADPAAQQRFLADKDLHSMFDNAALATLDGAIIASGPSSARPPNVADRDYFRRVRDLGQPAISAPLLTKGGQQPAVVMAVPVKGPDGRIAGVLGAALNLQRANVLGDLSRITVGEGGYYVIVTRGPSPQVVMHPDANLLLKPAATATVAFAGGTENDLATRAAIRSADWELRLIVPARIAYAPLEQARRNLLLQLLWLGLGCALMVWMGTTWVMRPLEALSNAIRTLRHSPDSPVKLDVVANDERGDLAREFDALMGDLREQRLEMAAVTDASPVGLFRCGTDGRMTYVNDEYLAIHGLAREDAQEGWLMLVREEIRDTVRQEWIRIVSAATPLAATRRLHRRDGTQVLVALRSRPVLAEGRVIGHVGTVTDITERTQADRALRTLTAIFDMTTDYIVQLDAAGRLIYMNPAARRRTGLALDAPIEQLSAADFNPPETMERFRSEIVPTAVSTGVWVGESVVWDAERRGFPVSHMVIAHRDKHGKVEYFSGLMRDISAAKTAERALRESEHRLRMVTDHLPALISYLDRDLRFRFANKAYQDWFGVHPEQLLGLSLREFYGDEAWAQMEPHMRAALAGRQVTYERRLATPGGRRDIQATLVPERNERGEVVGLYTLDSDITAHHEAEKALQESEARLRTVADALPMRVAYIDAEERYRFNNLAYERGFGLSRDQIQGHTVRELLGEPAYQTVQPHIRAALAGETVTFQSENAKSDSYYCYEAQYIPQPAVNDETIVGFHAVITDITRQKLEEKRLVNLAQIDPLTGLVNRAGFEVRLAEAMERARGAGALMALMYLDIDGFKKINDQFGHQTGDELLRGFAVRLSQALRSGDVRTRLGGDEFTVIVEGLPHVDAGVSAAAKLIKAMQVPFVIEERTIVVSTSIGLAFYQGGSATAGALVKQADEMLYQAKGAGRNNFQVAPLSAPGLP
ncbi:diguanylate cyclase (GGDEF)-like protein/PAS domain S-box-containing protein [Variovorax boronicumulans]|uniref:Diguanylate cyclase (GGDEF)-like protein/PAS domain S-box-containing protein n=1 Tax=Variovorax boronicumulans TaxID=436515 RepID=A0AAW8D920_9BURK|nr:PAS domain-containing protein [Variovorax boronicumulans]MDP9896764.1 diguanylate cyclase (GGDEF)-like protein/PAS domain S-box-containing protein [Variovorax boronicumulans]MDQ0056912.1 diguanylate cyclase (GGDEF)-like protein/PAS domain S-box-containing protein [Variovorax boronicumulans]